MSKMNKLRKKFATFTNQLTPDEVREQLVLAYLQMEKCLQVLRGEGVEPVAMKDNGLSSDLELFYMCKKVREELDYLNQNENKQSGKKITIRVEADIFDVVDKTKKFKEQVQSSFGWAYVEPILSKDEDSFRGKPSKKTLDAIRNYARENKPKAKYSVGNTLYYIEFGSICSLKVDGITYDTEETTFVYSDGENSVFEEDLFPTIEDLCKHLITEYNGQKREQ